MKTIKLQTRTGVRPDPHSYHNDLDPIVKHINWAIEVSFERKVLVAKAKLYFAEPTSGILDLDTKDLEIQYVLDDRENDCSFSLGTRDKVLGSCLRVRLPRKTAFVTISYITSPEASGLSWLDAEQTGGSPFVYTQGEEIHTRSYLPCQDTPGRRITYEVQITVPEGVAAVASATGASHKTVRGKKSTYSYSMPEPTAPYLIAFAAGNLTFRPIGARAGVWAHPDIVEAAATELEPLEKFIEAAEKLFGPYPWSGRCNMLILPQAFPFGGMENTGLVFLNKGILTGDGANLDVVAHELAHHWFGNLVTNANWDSFWLNEGWTMWAQHKIIRAVFGAKLATISAANEVTALRADLARIKNPEFRKLRPNLKNHDPDDYFSQVPYIKGKLFLEAIEQFVGEEQFLAFARGYIGQFAFQSLTTRQFLNYVEEKFLGVLDAINVTAWLHGTEGLPENAPLPASPDLGAIDALGAEPVATEMGKRWTPAEWTYYLDHLAPNEINDGVLTDLDARFYLTESQNVEILRPFLELAIKAGYGQLYMSEIEKLLGEHGRGKYLKPLYHALAAKMPEFGRTLFEKFKGRYHNMIRGQIEKIANAA